MRHYCRHCFLRQAEHQGERKHRETGLELDKNDLDEMKLSQVYLCCPFRIRSLGWGARAVTEMGEGGQKVQTFSCKINKSWGWNVQHGDSS